MAQRDIKKTIERVETMEWCFDTMRTAMERDPQQARRSPLFHALVRQLRRYYEDGQWLADFTADEAGSLPVDLKRGVLSEDGVYDFLAGYDEMMR